MLEVLTLQMLPAVPTGEVDSRLPEVAEEWLALDAGGQMSDLLRCKGTGKIMLPPPMTDQRKELRRICISMLKRRAEDRPAAKDIIGKKCLKDAINCLGRDNLALKEKLFRERKWKASSFASW